MDDRQDGALFACQVGAPSKFALSTFPCICIYIYICICICILYVVFQLVFEFRWWMPTCFLPLFFFSIFFSPFPINGRLLFAGWIVFCWLSTTTVPPCLPFLPFPPKRSLLSASKSHFCSRTSLSLLCVSQLLQTRK